MDQTVQCWGNDAFGKPPHPWGSSLSVSAGKGDSCWNVTTDTKNLLRVRRRDAYLRGQDGWDHFLLGRQPPGPVFSS